MFEYVPFEFPKSMDGKYTVCLDDAGVLRSRREQLGLTLQQVADMAGVQFSQYQRLEAGERSLSGCSMRTGLAICAVLLLDPCASVPTPMNHSSADSLKPQSAFDVEIPEEDIKKKVGRKQIKRNILTVYFNHPHYSIIIPHDVLIALGKPHDIGFLWDKTDKRLLIKSVDEPDDTSFDVPSFLYENCSALVFPPAVMISDNKESLGWNDELYSTECQYVRDKDENYYMLCNLKKAHPSDKISGPFVFPSCWNYIDEE